MKTKATKVILACIMALSVTLCGFLTASAEETATTEHVHCECGGTKPAGHTCDEAVVWTAWGDDEAEATLPKTTGYYYLTRDFDRAWTDTISADVHLCLNGYTVKSSSGAGYRLLNVGVEGGAAGSLTLCDCQGTGVIKDTTDISHSIAGRLIAVHAQGTFTMYGGIIEGGEAQTTEKNIGGWGGNIYNNGVFNMYGGTVTGGEALANASGVRGQGGNIYITATGVMNMYGGSVTGGRAVAGGNIYNLGTLNLAGQVTVTGAIGGGNLYVPTGKTVNATGILADSAVGITTEDVEQAFAAVSEEAQKACFTSDDPASVVVYSDGRLMLEGGHIHCVCGGTQPAGHECENVVFLPWDGTSGTGCFYLTEDMDISDVTVSGELVLCLNGCTVTSSGRALVSGDAKNTASVTDCVGGGVIQSANNSANGGLMFFMNGTFNIYGGTLQKTHEEAGINGMVVKLGNNTSSGGTFNMYGGTVRNGKIIGKGGNIYAIGNSVVNIQGGTIENGQASGVGDNIYIGSTKANTIANATIVSAANGDNVVMDGASTLIVDNCMISGGTGVVAMSGSTTLTGTMSMYCTTDLYVDNTGDLVVTLTELTDADGQITVDASVKPGVFAATDGDYTEVFAPTDDCFAISYAEGQLSLARTRWAAAYAGTQLIGNYATVTEAVAAAENGYVKLLDDVTEDVTVNGVVYLDLNGKTLTGTISGEGTLYGMDSSTDAYSTEGMGRVTGEVTCTVADSFKTEITGAIKRYMAIADETGYTFHRFYLGITHMSLKPGTTGVGYKAVFYADEQVQALLSETGAFGYTLQLEGFQARSFAMDADQFQSGKVVTLRIDNFDVANYSDAAIYGKVFLKFGDTTIESESYSFTLKQMVQNVAAAVEADSTAYTAEQMTALQTMCDLYKQTMANWDIDAILNWTAEAE